MTAGVFNQVCYRTEQREENVALFNIKNKMLGHSFGCTKSGETIQVKLTNGEYDSWSRDECEESYSEPL